MAAVCRDPAGAALPPRLRAIADYAIRLTLLDEPLGRADLDPLRAAGLSDAAIRDLAQIVGYFNYVNRQVDGLGVTLEDGHDGRRWAEMALPDHAQAR